MEYVTPEDEDEDEDAAKRQASKYAWEKVKKAEYKLNPFYEPSSISGSSINQYSIYEPPGWHYDPHTIGTNTTNPYVTRDELMMQINTLVRKIDELEQNMKGKDRLIRKLTTAIQELLEDE